MPKIYDRHMKISSVKDIPRFLTVDKERFKLLMVSEDWMVAYKFKPKDDDYQELLMITFEVHTAPHDGLNYSSYHAIYGHRLLGTYDKDSEWRRVRGGSGVRKGSGEQSRQRAEYREAKRPLGSSIHTSMMKQDADMKGSRHGITIIKDTPSGKVRYNNKHSTKNQAVAAKGELRKRTREAQRASPQSRIRGGKEFVLVKSSVAPRDENRVKSEYLDKVVEPQIFRTVPNRVTGYKDIYARNER
jgi:hypothetical protein